MLIPGWQIPEKSVTDSLLPLLSSARPGKAQKHLAGSNTCIHLLQWKPIGEKLMVPEQEISFVRRHTQTLLARNTLPLPEDSSFGNSNFRELPEPEEGE